MNIKINNLRGTVFFLIVTAFLSMITAFAQQGIGTSQIIIKPITANINPGSNISINYSVQLVSGNIWGTTISVNNQSSLLSEGIGVTFSNNGQDPNFSGVATITTSDSTNPGNYTLQFIATGDDPTTTPTTFTLVVNGKTTTVNNANTTTTNTNQTNTTKTTAPITTKTNSTTVNTVPYVNSNQNSSSYKVQDNYPSTSNQYPMYISIIAVIILFAVIIIRLKTL